MLVYYSAGSDSLPIADGSAIEGQSLCLACYRVSASETVQYTDSCALCIRPTTGRKPRQRKVNNRLGGVPWKLSYEFYETTVRNHRTISLDEYLQRASSRQREMIRKLQNERKVLHDVKSDAQYDVTVAIEEAAEQYALVAMGCGNGIALFAINRPTLTDWIIEGTISPSHVISRTMRYRGLHRKLPRRERNMPEYHRKGTMPFGGMMTAVQRMHKRALMFEDYISAHFFEEWLQCGDYEHAAVRSFGDEWETRGMVITHAYCWIED